MSFFISKFLPLFVYPLGLTWILLVLALWLKKKPKLQKTAILLAVALIWVGGSPWVSNSLTKVLEWQYLPPEEFPESKVIVILGGGLNARLYPRSTIEVNGAGDRVIYGAHLYHQGAAPQILITGGQVPWSGDTLTAADNMEELLLLLGVPKEAIWKESKSRNTYENALYSHQFLEKKGINEIILVTSAFHMPRSVMLFEQQGFEIIPAPTDYNITQAGWESLWEFDFVTFLLRIFPRASSLSLTSSSLKEILGILVYSIRG